MASSCRLDRRAHSHTMATCTGKHAVPPRHHRQSATLRKTGALDPQSEAPKVGPGAFLARLPATGSKRFDKGTLVHAFPIIEDGYRWIIRQGVGMYRDCRSPCRDGVVDDVSECGRQGISYVPKTLDQGRGTRRGIRLFRKFVSHWSIRPEQCTEFIRFCMVERIGHFLQPQAVKVPQLASRRR